MREAHLGLKKKEIVMSKSDWGDFRKADVCWLCEKGFEKEGEKSKVRDHCHYSGKFRGAAHMDCNRKFKKPNFTPVFFHNLANYDFHLFVRSLGLEDGVLKVKCIPNNEEKKYISFSIIIELKRIKLKNEFGETVEKVVKHEIRFVDSFKFMASSLEKLVENLTSCGKCESCKPGPCFVKDVIGKCRKFENCLLVDKPCFTPVNEFLLETKKHGTNIDLLMKKGVYPYDWMNSFEKFSAELPGKDAFFSRLNNAGIEDSDY